MSEEVKGEMTRNVAMKPWVAMEEENSIYIKMKHLTKALKDNLNRNVYSANLTGDFYGVVNDTPRHMQVDFFLIFRDIYFVLWSIVCFFYHVDC